MNSQWREENNNTNIGFIVGKLFAAFQHVEQSEIQLIHQRYKYSYESHYNFLWYTDNEKTPATKSDLENLISKRPDYLVIIAHSNLTDQEPGFCLSDGLVTFKELETTFHSLNYLPKGIWVHSSHSAEKIPSFKLSSQWAVGFPGHAWLNKVLPNFTENIKYVTTLRKEDNGGSPPPILINADHQTIN